MSHSVLDIEGIPDKSWRWIYQRRWPPTSKCLQCGQKPTQSGFKAMFTLLCCMVNFPSSFKDKVIPSPPDSLQGLSSCLLTLHCSGTYLLNSMLAQISPCTSRIHRKPLQPSIPYLKFWYSQDFYVLHRNWTTYGPGGMWERGMIDFVKPITMNNECRPIKGDGPVLITSIHHGSIQTKLTIIHIYVSWFFFCFNFSLWD